MPRAKRLPDEHVFRDVLDVMARDGAEGVTFASVAGRSGLSAATLVQRFGSKPAMIHAAMLHAWDQLDEKSSRLAGTAEPTPRGAIDLLCGLSGDYGDIDSYANSLHVLREDFRHPELRARGKAWIEVLSGTLGTCLSGGAQGRAGLGAMMVAQWQGALVLWAFAPDSPVDAFVRRHLEGFVAAVTDRA